MIIVTGAAGFIGSALIGQLLRAGYGDIVAVDDFSFPEKNKNFVNIFYLCVDPVSIPAIP